MKKYDYSSKNILKVFKEYHRIEVLGYATGDAELIELKMDLDLIIKALKVTPKQKEMFIMYYIKHMKQVEIAEHFGITQPSVNEGIKVAEREVVAIVRGWGM